MLVKEVEGAVEHPLSLGTSALGLHELRMVLNFPGLFRDSSVMDMTPPGRAPQVLVKEVEGPVEHPLGLGTSALGLGSGVGVLRFLGFQS